MHPRQDWAIPDYIEHLDYLHDIQDSLDPHQFKLLHIFITEEIKLRFPIEEREKYSLAF